MDCVGKHEYRIGLFKNIISQHVQELAQRAGRLPEEERSIYRQLYRKRQRQWRWCVEQLSEVEV